jgi:predicted ferric reductase
MVLRARLVKAAGGADRLRTIHVAVSLLAVAFIALHIYMVFLPPITLSVDLGYTAVALGLILWLTGVGFLEKNRDSFTLHGGFAVAVVTIITAHAAASGSNIPQFVSLYSLVVVSIAAFANAWYHAKRLTAVTRS